MEFIYSLFYFSLFLIIIRKWSFFQNEIISYKLFILLFFLKVISSIIQKYLFDNYNFGGDGVTFFQTGKYIYGFLNTNPSLFYKTLFGTLSNAELKHYFPVELAWTNDDFFFNDNQTIIRINALLNIISFGSYYVHSIIFCFFSTIGFNCLYKLFSSFNLQMQKEIFFITCFIPSTLFWCSNISKESWLVFCLGSLLFNFSILIKKFNLMRAIYFLLFLVSLIYIKVYFLFALIPALLAYFICYKVKNIYPIYFFLSVYTITFGIVFIVKEQTTIQYLQFKLHSFQYLAEWAKSNSIISIPDIGNSVWSLIKNTPVALWNIFSRPYIWEIKSVIWLPAAVENIVLNASILISIFFLKWNKEKAAISLLCIFFSITLLILIGLTTPIIGGLVRYKSILLPFLLMFFIFHFDYFRFKKSVSKWFA